MGPAVGLVAARRAVQVSGPRRTLSHPVIIEVEPRENIAAGRFGWGLGPWVPWQAPAGPVPPYPVASNQRGDRPAPASAGGQAYRPARSEPNGFGADTSALREEIRRLILEELSQLAGG